MGAVAYPRTAVVLPIRSFRDGKTRLRYYLSPAERAHLLQHMATGVVHACEDLAVAVVSSAPEVVAWARPLGLAVIGDPGSLDAAAAAGVEWARSQLFGRVVIIHADLPYARSLRSILTNSAYDGLVAVPGHRDGGSPAMSIPARTDFTFAYGPGSLESHIREADRLNMPTTLVHDRTLGTDLDTGQDLLEYMAVISSTSRMKGPVLN